MSVSWMVYATCVSLILASAAIFLERPLRERERNTHNIWAALLAGALLWPATVAVLGRSTAGDAGQPDNVSLRVSPSNATAAGRAAAPVLIPPLMLPAVLPTSWSAGVVARRVAMITPLLVLAVLLVELVRIARARRRWQRGVIDGIPVLLSADFGPAIVGVVNPQIVLPAWSLALPPQQRLLMLAHESEHLTSHDSRWLCLAFLAVLIAPWNLGVWWLLRRFRLAMEVDCDRRVLLRGHDLEQYGNLLLEIGRHGTGRSLLAAGFAERRSMVRARIDRMTVGAGVTWGRQAWRVAIGTTLLFSACILGPSRQHREPSGTGDAVHASAAYSIVVDTTVVLPHIQALLDVFPPPITGLPSVTTRFVRDTIRAGDQAELVTVTWFPKALRDSLRSPPLVRSPRLAGLSAASDLPPPVTARTRFVGGRLYEMYVLWQTMLPTSGGRIEVPPAVLSYRVPAQEPFPQEEQRTVQSSPAVLVVRPQK